MADIVTEGCKECPHCGRDAGAFLAGTVPFWRCEHGHITEGTLQRPPRKCAQCHETELELRSWHMKNCVCLECGESYTPIKGVFNQPDWLKDALEEIAKAANPPGQR